jgi:hypothetical protein
VPAVNSIAPWAQIRSSWVFGHGNVPTVKPMYAIEIDVEILDKEKPLLTHPLRKRNLLAFYMQN